MKIWYMGLHRLAGYFVEEKVVEYIYMYSFCLVAMEGAVAPLGMHCIFIISSISLGKHSW